MQTTPFALSMPISECTHSPVWQPALAKIACAICGRIKDPCRFIRQVNEFSESFAAPLTLPRPLPPCVQVNMISQERRARENKAPIFSLREKIKREARGRANLPMNRTEKDPCQLDWQVNRISVKEQEKASSRPLPPCVAGEQVQ